MTPASQQPETGCIVRDAIKWATAALTAADVENAGGEAGWILAHVLGVRSGLDVELRPERRLEAEAWRKVRALTERRARGEPLQYVLGTAGFYGMDLTVGPGVLIPRPETERLVDLAVERYPGSGPVCDLCTGSGAVALALGRELPGQPLVIGTDSSLNALRYADINRRRLDVFNLRLIASDLLTGLAHSARFVLITANPPYVGPELFEELPAEIVNFEPASALVAAERGLAVIRRIAESAPAHLAPGGWLLCEISSEQGEDARQLLDAGGFRETSVMRDYTGRDRVVMGRKPGPL